MLSLSCFARKRQLSLPIGFVEEPEVMGKKTPARGPYLLDVQLLRERIDAPERYPFCLPVVRHLSQLSFHPRVTFFVGENGTGKSTLIEALAVACDLNPEGGSANFN